MHSSTLRNARQQHQQKPDAMKTVKGNPAADEEVQPLTPHVCAHISVLFAADRAATNCGRAETHRVDFAVNGCSNGSINIWHSLLSSLHKLLKFFQCVPMGNKPHNCIRNAKKADRAMHTVLR